MPHVRINLRLMASLRAVGCSTGDQGARGCGTGAGSEEVSRRDAVAASSVRLVSAMGSLGVLSNGCVNA